MRDPAPLSRRAFVAATAAAALGTSPLGASAFGGPAAPAFNRDRFRLFGASAPDYSARAVALVQRSLVVDMLGVLTLDFAKQDAWMADPERFTNADFRPFRESGITALHPAVGLGGPDAYDNALKFFAGWNGFLAGQDQRFVRVDSATDFARAKATGRVGVILGLQNA